MPTTGTSRTIRIVVAALAVAGASAFTAACGTGTGAVGAPPAAGAAPQAPDPDREAPDRGVQVTRPPDPLAPSAYRQVARHGAPAAPGVRPASGNAGDQRSVRYSDGVTVRIDRVIQRLEQGTGPGVYPGRPHTALTLTLVNHSTKPLKLDQVVVTALYGAPARVAAPVYEDASAGDFSGVLAPAASASATYVFSVPTAALRHVVAIVDFDGVHVAARLNGAM